MKCLYLAGAPKIDGLVVDEVPAADDPKGDDCGVVVVAAPGPCPNENANEPVPEADVPFAVVVVAAGVLVGLLTGNENLGAVVVLLPVLALGALVEVPFPNTTLLGASVELLPNTLPLAPPNMLGVWVC